MDHTDVRYTAIWQRIVRLFERLCYQFDLDRKFRWAQHYAEQHPIITLLLLVLACVLSLPVGFFFLFVAGSIAFTFMGFIFVEG